MLFYNFVLTAFIISALIVLPLVFFFVGFIFVDKFVRGRSGPQRWYAQNIYAVGFLIIIGLVALLLFKISGSISWQYFSIGVIVVVVVSAIFGVGQFLSLKFGLWWTKSIRKKVSKWPESPLKHRVEKYVEGNESYYGLKLYKSEASEIEGRNPTPNTSTKEQEIID